MCAIIGSFDEEKAKELITLNSYRGSHSHSTTIFKNGAFVNARRAWGAPDKDQIKLHNEYGVFHVQAPTGADSNDLFAVHPSWYKGTTLLWHNGIVKANEIDVLSRAYEIEQETTWDTYIINQLVVTYGFDILSQIDGSFACLFYKGLDNESKTLYAFRNEISPLFIDKHLNISSTKFEGSQSLEPNKIFVIDLINKIVINTGQVFKTKMNPYWLG
jgi:asparagine synthetase B (glutamine-hydrolysing)